MSTPNYAKLQEDLYNRERKLGKYAPDFKEEAAPESAQKAPKAKSKKKKIWPFGEKEK